MMSIVLVCDVVNFYGKVGSELICLGSCFSVSPIGTSVGNTQYNVYAIHMLYIVMLDFKYCDIS